MTETTTIFTLSEKDARKKIIIWNQDKKNLTILSCIPVQRDDKGYEITYSYDKDSE